MLVNVKTILTPIVESLGLSWNGQRGWVKRNPVLNNVCRSVRVTRVEPNRKRDINMLDLPISHFSGFLFGFDANRVRILKQELITKRKVIKIT